jgi:hypothetical protein
MGKLAAVDFKSHTNDVCNICSKPGKKGKCCKDEYKYCRADISSREVANVQQNSESSVKALSLPVIIVPVPALTTTDLTGINNNHCPVGL